MEQLSSQKRVNVPSDDPVAASRLVQLGREQAAIKQYQSNITSLSGALSGAGVAHYRNEQSGAGGRR
ncbi:flagellar hook-associated protein FlgL [Kluyvera cryocrescens]|uniref:Flagellar hook-associated protein FlgL n=1 Tax=Kluyvera cryocrescens TaxID=580 RepID=A0A485AJI7_KLUCR|nr:flagellar hook-associated protein FlgL [Kluyvera cryocrescens]